MTHYLDDIIVRERKTRAFGALFALIVALMAAIAVSTLAAAIHAASTRVVMT